MAYFKITPNKKGELQAKIQVSGKDLSTGKNKLFVKRVYNTDGLTEAKFRKQVEKLSIEFEEDVLKAYKEETTVLRSTVLTFSQLMQEWKATIKANLSINYYTHAERVEKLFTAFLKEHRLDDKPISAITVRDVQIFLNSFTQNGYARKPTVKMKKDFPKAVSFRELARENVITRCSSYGLRRKGNSVEKETALAICERYSLDFDEYFEETTETKPYSVETIKGYRRILRTLFNEAVRYEWIAKNPVCGTKIGAGSSNTSLRAVPEKEVFTFKEAREFLKRLDEIPDEFIYKRIPLKFMLLTGVRNAEMCGLRWSDIDFTKKVVCIKQNRLYSRECGIYEKDPKTKTSKREIPLTDALINDLLTYMEWFRLADEHFDERLEEYYIAVTLYRTPVFPQTIGNWLKEYERQWNMKRVSCHGLRHTYCSLLLSQNVPIQTVSKYMGHSDSTVTLKVYSHFIPDTQDKAINALNNLI
jgi:integrase